MKRKVLALLVATAMIISLVGCGGKVETEATTVVEVENTVETVTDIDVSETQAALDDLANALNGTCWVGMDSQDYSCYSLGFDADKMGIYSNVEGDEGIEGYWKIGLESLYVYDDEECTNQIYEIPWSYDDKNKVIVLNDRAYLSQVEGDMSTAAEAIQQYALAAQVGEFLDGTVWAGSDADGALAMAFTFEDGKYYMGIVGTDASTAKYSGNWSIDYDSIYLYDDSDSIVDSLSWDMAEDGSELYFTVDSSQMTFTLVQTDADNIEDAMTSIMDSLVAQ